MKFLKQKHGFALLMISISLNAFAQEDAPLPVAPKPPAATNNKDKRTQNIDFGDELIQGDVNKPELFYLLQKKQFNFKRLIKLREDFLPEMRRTSEDVQRSGGKH